MTEHHERVEEIQTLIALVEIKGEPTQVTVARDDGTLAEIVICDDEERDEVLAVLRRELNRMMH